ncbi:MAG: homoserine O-acetyltransferase MetX [Thermoguttaceae bacterium]
MTDTLYDSSDSVRSAAALPFAQYFHIPGPFTLEHGSALPEVVVCYETYGTLNGDADNAILISHALSGDSHVASHDTDGDTGDPDGWWEIMVGPGKPIDTDRFFVICPNTLGGCRGTTGPNSIDPRTNEEYGMSFPVISVGDIVEMQRRLADHLGITRLLCVIGGSLGGLAALEWSIRFPDRIAGAALLATGQHLTSQALAFDIVARNAIISDPHFHGGRYRNHNTAPATGLAIARMLGHITYLSEESMRRKFAAERNKGRTLDTQFETKFAVGSYLAYQGDKFVERFDANSYLTISMAIDMYDLGTTHEQLVRSLRRSMCRWLVLSFSSDWLFPPYLSREIADALVASGKRVSYCDIPSDCGHDAFLLANEIHLYGEMVRGFLLNLEKEGAAAGRIETASTPDKPLRIDYRQIIDLIPRGSKVLDLGCGKGRLLERLRRRGDDRVMGIEIDPDLVLYCLQHGLDVVQADLNFGLHPFDDKQFDFVVLSKTLQTITDVERIVDEMLRVGTRCIVSFPNLGYQRHRQRLADEGRAPQVDSREGRTWYNTSDVRFLTIADLEDFCASHNIRIHARIALDTQRGVAVTDDQNLNADVAIFVLGQ